MASKPIIVLIPGAFHRPSHYNDVISPLRNLGYQVFSTPLVTCGDTDTDVSPLSTPSSDASAIHSSLLPLLNSGHTALLVAHSYGSLVATRVAHNQTVHCRSARNLPGGIIGLISIAGFAFPTPGKNVLGSDAEIPLRPNRVLKDGLISLTEGAKGEFYNDLEEEKADQAFGMLCRYQSHASVNALPEVVEREIQVKKVYVLCERDRTVMPEFQEEMVRVGGFDRVIRMNSGHSPFLTRPAEVVEVILGVARDVDREDAREVKREVAVGV